MKGDFTRDTFDQAKHFSRVLMQQGRVTLDADHNEQTAILLHYLRTLARDLIGPYAAPVEDSGFILTSDAKGQLHIGKGRYYVDGILVENEADCLYTAQPDYPLAAGDPLAAEIGKPVTKVWWMYLDVWERHITALDDDDIREDALNGPDTCTRAKVVWQVKALPTNMKPSDEGRVTEATCETPLDELTALSDAYLAARVDPGHKVEDACVIPPDSKYRGNENQLYRVEIHDGGTAGTGGAATFKWSRDNGSVAAAWLGTQGDALLVSAGRGFAAGNWIELTDDVMELQGVPGTLVLLTKVEGDTLSAVPGTITLDVTKLINPKVRRWDQTPNDKTTLTHGVIAVQESTATTDLWLDLEDGVQVRFGPGGTYRTGDYWLFPARVSTGNIEWPTTVDSANNVVQELLPPDGIEHHFAPLGFVAWQDGAFKKATCRCVFEPLSSCFSMGSGAVGAQLLAQPADSPAQLRPLARAPKPVSVTRRKRQK